MNDARVDRYMPLFIGDYLKDTADLTAEEHGVYLMLLIRLWNAGGYLPYQASALARITALKASRWAAVWAIVGRFFDVLDTGDGSPRLSQKRLLAELERARTMRARRSATGSIGGKASVERRSTIGQANVEAIVDESLSNRDISLKHPDPPLPVRSETSVSESLPGILSSPDQSPDQTRVEGSDDPTLMVFPCDGMVPAFVVRESLLTEHSTAYPALDVLAEYRKARVWLDANPGRRKTARGMRAFLVNWLSRAQNSGRGMARPQISPARNFTQEANDQVRLNYLQQVAAMEGK